MKVSKTFQGTVAILSLKDSFVADEFNQLDATLLDCYNIGMSLFVLDMRNVPFIDSAGLERLQVLVSELGKRGGDLRISSLNEVCKDIFTATRMDSFLQVADDKETVVRSLA